MKHLLLLIPIYLFTISVIYSQQYEDIVYLKNGSEIHGTIIEQIPNESIKIKTKDGNIFVYKMDEIDKMTKEEIKREKVERAPSTSIKHTGSNNSGFGIRGGLGTDITLSIGFGLGAFYVLAPSSFSTSNWDFGIDIYYANVSEETVEGSIRYKDKTELVIFTLRANGLFNYKPHKSGVYFVAGTGLVLGNVSWGEDIIYSAPYYPHTEPWDFSAFSVGNVLNLGIGLTFGGGFETRFETPLLIFYSVPGYGGRSASSVVPTFTFNALYRFP